MVLKAPIKKGRFIKWYEKMGRLSLGFIVTFMVFLILFTFLRSLARAL